MLAPPSEFLLAQNGNIVTFDNTSRYATSWHWDFGDNTSSEERNPGPHTYAADGVYTVTLTTQNWCCSESYTTQVTIGNPNGVDEAIGQAFELYPNPANGAVTINISDGETYKFELLDFTGKILRNGTISNNSQLIISDLPKGKLYF